MDDDRTNSFSGRLAFIVAAMRALDEDALHRATWEPHDWSDFS